MCHQGRNLRAPGGRQLYRAEGWKLEVRCLARPVLFQAQNCRERWQLGKGIRAASGDGEDDRAISESVGGLGGQMHGSSWAWDGMAKMQGDRKGRWEQGVGLGEQHGTSSASRVAMATTPLRGRGPSSHWWAAPPGHRAPQSQQGAWSLNVPVEESAAFS